MNNYYLYEQLMLSQQTQLAKQASRAWMYQDLKRQKFAWTSLFASKFQPKNFNVKKCCVSG